MKNKPQILILLLLLLLIPTSTVFACGDSTNKENTEKSSCSKENDQSEKKSCCDKNEKDDDGCGGNCDNSSCHCPISVNAPVFLNNFNLQFTTNFYFLGNDCTYVQHNPKAIYYSIWQPPKIS